MSVRDDVLIVGGGVIGRASGLALLQAGRSVRVLEAGTAGCGSSHGNCGTITPSHAAPLAAPGTIAKALSSGNRLEALKGDRKGQWTIRINDQWRVCFTWTGTAAEGVEIVDYH